MNTDPASAAALARAIVADVNSRNINLENVGVAVCPPDVNLTAVAEVVGGTGIGLGAQNMHPEMSGAYTGETSAAMLNQIGCTHVILGHSERRQYFKETNAFINQKVKRALSEGLIPILCVGETLAERERNEAIGVVRTQLKEGLADVTVDDPGRLVLAYEPVWAIGTGRTATPEQAQEMHAFIRAWISNKFGKDLASGINVLYGGSVKPGNAATLFAEPDIDGGLIGGAGLKADSFGDIIAAAAAQVGA